jgi:glycosyltransferase involved in cell wall biosynthesis
LKNIDLIVPCFNPREGWHENFLEQFRALERAVEYMSIHCILVNDGSTIKIKSSEIEHIQNNISSFKYISLEKNQGKGSAIRSGLLHCKHDLFMFTDVDFPYFPEFAKTMIEHIENDHYDIMIGHRPAAYYKQIPILRRILSKSLRNLIKLVMNIPVADTQSGLKVFNRKGFDALLSTTIDGYLFDLEFIRIAAQKNLRIGSTELIMRPEIIQPQMSISALLQESQNFIKILLKK